VEIVELFEEDAETDAVVVFGEPGTTHEQEVAAAVAAERIGKPVVALLAGEFQERYPRGASFGHLVSCP
jgi:succinyl-CoA synthetase alpha subunit